MLVTAANATENVNDEINHSDGDLNDGHSAGGEYQRQIPVLRLPPWSRREVEAIVRMAWNQEITSSPTFAGEEKILSHLPAALAALCCETAPGTIPLPWLLSAVDVLTTLQIGQGQDQLSARCSTVRSLLRSLRNAEALTRCWDTICSGIPSNQQRVRIS